MLLPAISIPNFLKTRTSQSSAIINNLRQLDGAKQQWALENHKSAEDVPTFDDLKPYVRVLPPTLVGEKYDLGKVADPVTADVEKREASRLFGNSSKVV